MIAYLINLPFYFSKNIRSALKGSIAHYPAIAQFFVFAGMFLISEVIFSLLAISFAGIIYPGINFYHLIQSLNELKSADEVSLTEANALKMFQFVTSIGRFILIPLLFIHLAGHNFEQSLNIKKPPQLISFVLILFIVISVSGEVNLVNEWNHTMKLPASMSNIEITMRQFEEQAKLQTEIFLRTTTITGFLVNIFIVGILAAIGEEIVFRGILQNIFYKWTNSSHASIWIAAFLFSFVHLQFFGFFPRLLLGALLGYLYYWSGSLWSCIFAHFVNNTAAVTAYFLLNIGLIEENIAETSSLTGALISLPVVSLLIYLYIRNTKKDISYAKGVDDDLYN